MAYGQYHQIIVVTTTLFTCSKYLFSSMPGMTFDDWLSKIAFDTNVFEMFSPLLSSILQNEKGKL